MDIGINKADYDDSVESLLREEIDKVTGEIHRDMELYQWWRGAPTDLAKYNINDHEHLISLFQKGVKALTLTKIYNSLYTNSEALDIERDLVKGVEIRKGIILDNLERLIQLFKGKSEFDLKPIDSHCFHG